MCSGTSPASAGLDRSLAQSVLLQARNPEYRWVLDRGPVIRPRISRDVCLLLRHGGCLDNPTDPGGGSFHGFVPRPGHGDALRVFLPWVVEIMDRLRLFGFIPVDLVSMTFAVTGLTFLPALCRFHLLDLPPVAWATVVYRMDDVVVVIDPWFRILNLNPAAERLIGRKSREVRGAERPGHSASGRWLFGLVESKGTKIALSWTGPSRPRPLRSMCGFRPWARTSVPSAGFSFSATLPGSSKLSRSGFACSASKRRARGRDGQPGQGSLLGHPEP